MILPLDWLEPVRQDDGGKMMTSPCACAPHSLASIRLPQGSSSKAQGPNMANLSRAANASVALDSIMGGQALVRASSAIQACTKVQPYRIKSRHALPRQARDPEPVERARCSPTGGVSPNGRKVRATGKARTGGFTTTNRSVPARGESDPLRSCEADHGFGSSRGSGGPMGGGGTTSLTE